MKRNLVFNFKNNNQPIVQNTQIKSIQNTKIYSIIPLNIFQSWHTLNLPSKMKSNVELLQKQNPEFTYYLYDDDMSREFIKTHFDEEVLYTFDKLKPGAFKCDLWRCCVLYIKGGIYLDIKYHCINDFKLIQLTNNEYYVRDKSYQGITGIYNALICSMPNNKILYNCIQLIIENVKNNTYEYSELYVSGPHIMSSLFNNIDINKLTLTFNGNSILLNDISILKIYDEYRTEQKSYQLTKYYKEMWDEKNIYHYPVLQSTKTINFTRKITKNIMGKNVELFSGTPTIIKITNDTYLINIRWINYNYYDDGSKQILPQQWISLNSRFIVNKDFIKISDETFLQEDFIKEQHYSFIGLEDLRIYNFKDNYYYISTYFDNNRKITSTSFDIYNPTEDKYELNRNIILPNMYDINYMKQIEKNWSLIEIENELCVIYKWFPLQIGKIDYTNKQMNIIKINYNIPNCFKGARGTTCGYIRDNEIWFVLHKAQHYIQNKKYFFNYQHFFAVFDLNMNFIRCSELFKLGDCKVEFCVGLIIQNNEIILSYSLLDTNTMVSVYNIDTINQQLKWYFE